MMLDFNHIIILLLTGLGAGFAGGLLGLGGAFLMTPVQYIIYTDMGLPPDLAIRTAFGTSLLVVLPAAVSGAWRHHRNGVVLWRVAVVMGITSMVFALGGATLSAHASGAALKLAFGVIIILAAVRMLTAREPKYKIEASSNVWQWMLWAIPIGILSGMFGIGGGIVMIPIMVLALRFEMHYAIGTSLAVMILTSIGGVLGYILNGIGVAGRLPYSLGYIDLTAWLLLAVPAVASAQLGAAAAHKLPRKPLMYIFVVILLYMGLRMAGLFDWLGWPI